MTKETYRLPAVIAALCGRKRPHKGTGETFARGVITAAILNAKVRNNLNLEHSVDQFGNLLVQVGEDNGCVFTSHMDTVHREDGDLKLNILLDELTGHHFLMADDAVTGMAAVLGADDAAGIYILTEMIKAGVQGLYMFFVGEEVGGIGSSALVRANPSFSANMVVSFDRRGTEDIITHQGFYNTASNTFALALANQLNKSGLKYRPDDSGMYTDSKEFAGIVPECTNIAVGYDHEHTKYEELDLTHLEALRDAVLAVDWAGLPITRIPIEDVPWLPTGGQKWQDVNYISRRDMEKELARVQFLHEAGQMDDSAWTEFLRFVEEYLE